MPKQQVTQQQQLLAKRIEQALAHAKHSLNKSKALVAEECGVTAQAVNNWLRRGKISKQSLMALAEATTVNFMWLYTGIGSIDTDSSQKGSSSIGEEPAPYTLNKKILSQSIQKILEQSDSQQLQSPNYQLLAQYITAEYCKAVNDDDVIQSLIELSES